MHVMTRASVLLLGVLLLIQLSWSRPIMGWTLDGHRLIALDALAVLPPAMREALAPHVPMLLGGVVEPDFNRVVSHKIQIISLRGTPQPPRSGAPDEFKRLATSAQEMVRLDAPFQTCWSVDEVKARVASLAAVR
jgi:hypothetical protein